RGPAAGGAATAAPGLGGARAASRPRRPVGPHRRRPRGPAPRRGHPRHCAGCSRSRPCPAARGRRGARTRPCARRCGPQAMSSVASKRAAAAKSAKKPAAKTVAKKATKAAAAGQAVAKPRIRARARAGRLAKPEVHELFSRLRELNPRPTTELEYSTPFELLVAVALSAQATDVGVNKATRRLFPVANTPAAILALGEDGLKQYINTIGLFNAKAANVIATCRILLEKHGGEVPREREALEALPGVGRKTANVVLNTAFGEPTIAVDTHIFRVSNRTGLAPGKDVRAVEDELLRTVPAEFMQDAHHWLILHGRYVCKARKPECPRCVIRDLCRFPDKTPGSAED